MFINKKEKFSIRKFKGGRSDSVKIGTVGLIIGTALAMAAGTQTVEAAMKENSNNTTTISNDKGSVIVDNANIKNPNEGKDFETDPTESDTKTITKTGKVDYKYVTADGNTVLEENKKPKILVLIKQSKHHTMYTENQEKFSKEQQVEMQRIAT